MCGAAGRSFNYKNIIDYCQTPKDSIAHEGEGNQLMGKDDMTGLDMDQHKLWGPINGVEITGGIVPTSSNYEGRFRASRTSSCGTLNFVNAKLRYNILDPQDKFPGHYTLTQDWQPDCWWVPECLPGAGPSPTGNGTLRELRDGLKIISF